MRVPLRPSNYWPSVGDNWTDPARIPHLFTKGTCSADFWPHLNQPQIKESRALKAFVFPMGALASRLPKSRKGLREFSQQKQRHRLEVLRKKAAVLSLSMTASPRPSSFHSVPRDLNAAAARQITVWRRRRFKSLMASTPGSEAKRDGTTRRKVSRSLLYHRPACAFTTASASVFA